jgi:hypothetical protein
MAGTSPAMTGERMFVVARGLNLALGTSPATTVNEWLLSFATMAI